MKPTAPTKKEATLTWAERLAGYRERLTVLQSDAGRIEQERKSLALSAADGNQTAIARLSQLLSDEATLDLQTTNLRSAIEQAEAGIAEERAAELRALGVAGAVRTRKAVEGRIAASESVDRCLALFGRYPGRA